MAKKIAFSKTLVFVISVIGLLLAMTYVIHLRGIQQQAARKGETFYITIDVSSLLGEIERIEYVICGEKTFITSYKDEQGSLLWGEKIITPEQLLSSKIQECPVEIRIIKNGSILYYPADQTFDCPDCDGSHYYRVTDNKAVYRYSP